MMKHPKGAAGKYGTVVRCFAARSWIVILCMAAAFAAAYLYTANRPAEYEAAVIEPETADTPADTYTATGTMYVMNNNPNLVNYQYTNDSDLNSVVQLLDTYMAVVKSSRITDTVAERLAGKYPGLTADDIKSALSTEAVQDTGIMRIRCRTADAQMSADIVNTVLETAPDQIVQVVGAGSASVIDYAEVPAAPDEKAVVYELKVEPLEAEETEELDPVKAGLIAALLAGALSAVILAAVVLSPGNRRERAAASKR